MRRRDLLKGIAMQVGAAGRVVRPTGEQDPASRGVFIRAPR